MKHIARVGKVWKNKKSGGLFERKLVLKDGDSIANYAMVPEPKKEKQAKAPEPKKEKGIDKNE